GARSLDQTASPSTRVADTPELEKTDVPAAAVAVLAERRQESAVGRDHRVAERVRNQALTGRVEGAVVAAEHQAPLSRPRVPEVDVVAGIGGGDERSVG